MNNKIYTIEEIKNIIASVAKKYPLKEVYLFGSYARGEANENSDIDLVINFSESITLFTYAEIIEELEKLFGKKLMLYLIVLLVRDCFIKLLMRRF